MSRYGKLFRRSCVSEFNGCFKNHMTWSLKYAGGKSSNTEMSLCSLWCRKSDYHFLSWVRHQAWVERQFCVIATVSCKIPQLWAIVTYGIVYGSVVKCSGWFNDLHMVSIIKGCMSSAHSTAFIAYSCLAINGEAHSCLELVKHAVNL